MVVCPTFLSNSVIFAASSLYRRAVSRSLTKARTTKTLIRTARLLLRTLAAMMAPCSTHLDNRNIKSRLSNWRNSIETVVRPGAIVCHRSTTC